MLILERSPTIRAVPKSADLDTECSLISGLRLSTEEALNIKQPMKLFDFIITVTTALTIIIELYYNFIIILCAFVGVIININ
jgi:hypothetical protein